MIKGKKKKPQQKKPSVKKAPVKKQGPKVPAEWLYLFEGEIKLRQIYELLKDSPWNVEYWEEAEVLEVELPEAGSVDFEDLEGTLGDEESDAWLQEQQIHTVFAVTIRPDDYELAKKVMEHIVSLVDGDFCADKEKSSARRNSCKGSGTDNGGIIGNTCLEILFKY